ncbi:MAG: Gfo/Idh/MocA family oxidoreductase, partial [Pseudomonadota bacterium]
MALKVAVIGLGYFSSFHLAAWAEDSRVVVSGATDLDPARRAAAAEAHGVRVFNDTATLLAEAPDIVDIVAPPPAHSALVGAASAPGRVVICQKPFCTSPGEAAAVAAAAEAAGATLIIHENFRFQPWHRTLKAELEASAIGRVFQARFALRPGDGQGADAYAARQPAFRTMPRLLIHETGVHFIDLFRWLFGEIESVYADLRRLN